MSTEIKNIKLDNIIPSTTNPRKSFEKQGLLELADSIKEHGVLQPILVRPILDNFDADLQPTYYLVYGERRLRASIMAGMETIKAEIGEFTDDQAFEIQILENLHREDINPIDEARAFQSLIKKESLEWLAAKVNRSQKYVLDRIKLLDLCETAMFELENGVLPLGHAVLLSKIDKETQEKVIKTTNLFSEKVILGGANQIYCSKTLTQLKESIAGTMLSFQRINFDLDNENLIPKAGSCQAFPKRTINQNLLFSDITASDLCTDSICYNMKIQAQLNIDIEKSKADFGDVLLAEKDRWSSNALRIKGAAKSVYFQTEKTDDFCVPVVINKTDNYDQINLGITVFIKDQTKEVLEEAENISQSNNWELQQNQKTDEVIIPRFQRVFNTLGSRLIPEFSNAFFIDNLMRIEFKNLVILSNLLDEKLCENTGEAIRLLANSMNYIDRDDLRKIICISLSKNLPQQTLINILVLEDIVGNDFEDETDDIVSIRKYFEIIGLSENPENNLKVVDMEEVSTKPQTT
jgi:ParB/RepB/Spo0J family partition protein